MFSRATVFLLTLLSISCANRVRVTNISSSGIEIQLTSKTPESLFGTWYRHKELELFDTLVFVNEQIDTVLQRGKYGMQIDEDGTFFLIEPAADDRPTRIQGIWIYDSKYQILDCNFNRIEVGLLPMSKTDRKPFAYKIENLSKQLLKVRLVCSE